MNPDNRSVSDTLRGPYGTGACVTRIRQLRAVSTLHGVVCLYDNATNLLLWNPSIRRHLRIPIPTSRPRACETAPHFKHCGFWIDPCTKEFKVVIFFTPWCSKGGSLFSSRDRKWRELSNPEMSLFCLLVMPDIESPMVLMHGVAHWTAKQSDPSRNGFIVYFDFVRGKFGWLGLVKLERDPGSRMHVSKWRGHLSIVSSRGSDCNLTGFDVWVLQNGSWGRLERFGLMEGVARVLFAFELTRWGAGRLASTDNGELLLCDSGDDGVVFVACPSIETGHVLYSRAEKPNVFCFAYDFVESLIFPDQDCIPSVWQE